MGLNNFLTFVIAGFIAQLIGGALGMGYGISSNLLLMSFGVPPAVATASIHVAELFTAGASGFTHWKLDNVDKALFQRLAISGVIGAVVGAFLLTQIPGQIIRPYIAIYLLVMGLVILYKGFRKAQLRPITTHIAPLGMVGAFFDAIGGGGWGTIVASTLLARGNHPRKTVGSVTLARFFVSLSVSITLLGVVSLSQTLWMILGLIMGGLLAAPLAVMLTSRIPVRALMLLAGSLIVLLSLSVFI